MNFVTWQAFQLILNHKKQKIKVPFWVVVYCTLGPGGMGLIPMTEGVPSFYCVRITSGFHWFLSHKIISLNDLVKSEMCFKHSKMVNLVLLMLLVLVMVLVLVLVLTFVLVLVLVMVMLTLCWSCSWCWCSCWCWY